MWAFRISPSWRGSVGPESSMTGSNKAAWYQVSPWDALAEGYSRPAIDVQTLWAIIFQVSRAFLWVLLSAEGTSNWMLLCTYLAAFMCHQAFFQIQVKGTSWTSLPSSPTISALSTVPLHWFSSNRFPAWLLQGSCCCVVLGQYRTAQMLMFLCSHIPSWVSVSAVGEQILSPSSEGSSGTQATCKYHLQNAVSRWNSRFTSPQFPSLPAPATLLLFFAINSPAAQGKIMSLHPPFHISPLPSSSNAILPPITVFCWPCHTN